MKINKYKKDEIISIILPTYNSLTTLKRCIKSILNQKLKYQIELIIIDDNSSDGKNKFIRDLKFSNKNKIKIIQNKTNKGVGYCRRKGIKSSKGFYVAFIDADDYWLPNKLSKQIDFMVKNKIRFTFSEYLIENGNYNKKLIHVSKPSTISLEQNKYINNIPNSTTVITSYLAKKYKYPNLRVRNDYLYWNTLLKEEKNLKAYNINPGKVYSVYGCSKGISSNKINLIIHQWKLYRLHFKYSRLDSLKGLFYNFLLNLKKITISHIGKKLVKTIKLKI